jgi:hypothetical protein
MTDVSVTTPAAPKKKAGKKSAKPKGKTKAKAKAKAAPKGKSETKAKPAAEPKARTPKPLDEKIVALIALLKTKAGATNEEAADKLKFKKARDVRAAIRDKVRKLHKVTKEFDATRGGNVFRIVD